MGGGNATRATAFRRPDEMKTRGKADLMPSSKLFLGLDIGGTTVKAALVSEERRMLARGRIGTPDLADARVCERFAARLARFVREQRAWPADVMGIGIAVPGTVSGASVELLPNISLDLQVLLERLHDAFGSAELACLNDANAAALAEARLGAGRSAGGAGAPGTLVFVTLGTGVGSGIVVNGRLLEGATGAAGEIGHLRVAKGGRRCNCGRRGCLEQYASARGIVRTFREVDANAPAVYADLDRAEIREEAPVYPVDESDSKSVFEAYKASDARALRAVSTFTKALGFALGQVASVLNPDLFVLGGGVSESAPLFFPALVQSFRANCIGPTEMTPIEVAELGYDAGSLGAALYAMDARD